MKRLTVNRLRLACAALLLCGCGQRVPLPAPLPPAPRCPQQSATSSLQTVDRMRHAVLKSLALLPGMSVGDIGTGGGWFTRRIAVAVGKDGKVYGTDIDATTLSALRNAPSLGDDAAPIRLSLVTSERDTGLDNLPDNSLDLILMIDSLCFDQRQPRQVEIGYLQKFLAVLRPGGRLIHHMDCTCETTVMDVTALFVDAGFKAPTIPQQLTCDELSTDACPTAQAQARAKFVGVFQKAP